MVRKALLLATGISAALIAVAPQTNAQSAPRVRVSSRPFTNASTIQPSVSLSEPAYMLAVAIDRDGEVSVLSPVGPNDIFRFNAEKNLLLPEFFSGFSSASYHNFSDYSYTRNYSYIRNMYEDNSTGSILVIASKTPFNFAAIMDGPFWSEDAIKKLVRYRSPSGAVAALGRAVTAKGQSFGYDYMSFAPRPYQVSSADPCSALGFSPYGYAGNSGYFGNFRYSAFDVGTVLVLPTATSAGAQIVGMSDGCGRIRYIIVPIRVLPPKDTTAIPVDSAVKPATKTIIAAEPGTYTGEAAIRVYEMVKRNTSDTYAGLPRMPILQEQGDAIVGRTVLRDAPQPERVETFERVKNANSTPIERAAPVLRQAEPQRQAPAQPVMRSEPVSQPIMRSEPVSQSAGQVQREAVAKAKDN